MEKIKVCVADDNRELVGLLTEYIEGQEDMEVLGVAYNGQECLTLFKDKEPDVLLLDIIMPHLDGLAVLERLRENNEMTKQPSVIMLTAFGQEDVTKSSRFGRILFHFETIRYGKPRRSYSSSQWKRHTSQPSIFIYPKQCPSQQT